MNIRKRLIFFILMIFVLPTSAAASTEKPPKVGFFFVEKVDLNKSSSGVADILIFCDTNVSEQIDGIIITLGGEMKVNEYVDGIILTLFTKTISTKDVKYGIINLKYFELPLNLLFGLLILTIFKEFSEEMAAYIEKNKRSVLKFSLYGYCMAILLIGIFFISVAGAVFAICGIAGLIIISLIGNVPISIFLGHKLLSSRVDKYNSYMLFIFGTTIINGLKYLPALGQMLTYLIIPMLSLGVLAVYVIHKYFYRDYAELQLEKGYDMKFEKDKIKSLVLKDVDK